MDALSGVVVSGSKWQLFKDRTAGLANRECRLSTQLGRLPGPPVALKRDAGRCTIPGCFAPAPIVDHIVTRPRGVTRPCSEDRLDNLRSLCPNARRTDQGTPRRPAWPTLIRANLTLRNVVD
jgi:hypothetical protein